MSYHHFHPEYLRISWVEKIKNIIIFIDENLLGIIFCFLCLYLLFRLRHVFRNHKIIKKYKRENGDNDKKFTTMRCEEDGDKNRRHYVYLINKENKTYRWIEDDYTLRKLGYGAASRENNLFSNKNYTVKERIKVHNITIIDIKGILDILKLKNN